MLKRSDSSSFPCCLSIGKAQVTPAWAPNNTAPSRFLRNNSLTLSCRRTPARRRSKIWGYRLGRAVELVDAELLVHQVISPTPLLRVKPVADNLIVVVTVHCLFLSSRSLRLIDMALRIVVRRLSE